MKIQIAETIETIEFTVLDREDASEETLSGMYYALQDNIYRKGYPKSALMFPQDLRQMEKNHNEFLVDELNQDNRTPAGLDTALEWLCDEFKQRDVRWWLVGSGALYVRGINVKPHDLDVMTYKTEIQKIREMVTPYIVEPFHHVNGWVVKGFGVINYCYRIDFAFEPESWVDSNGLSDYGPYAQAHVEPIQWHGRKILVPPIELQIAPNEMRGRHDRVALIREYVKRDRTQTFPPPKPVAGQADV